MKYTIATGYKFVKLSNLVQLKEAIKVIAIQNNILGTILIADEGINFTISSDKASIDKFLLAIKELEFFVDLEYNSLTESNLLPFQKMKVRLKREIVALKDKDLDLFAVGSGRYLNSEEWDNLITREDVMLIDTRNNFEYSYGTFKGAINPETESFAELPQWLEKKLSTVNKNQKIAMFCTGGIRCEKSTAYLKSLGFHQVYHIKGGILQYLRDNLDKDKSLWEGNLFIFDDRIALDKNLKSISES